MSSTIKSRKFELCITFGDDPEEGTKLTQCEGPGWE